VWSSRTWHHANLICGLQQSLRCYWRSYLHLRWKQRGLPKRQQPQTKLQFITVHKITTFTPRPLWKSWNSSCLALTPLLITFQVNILASRSPYVTIGLLIQKHSCQEPRIDSTVSFCKWLYVLCTIVQFCKLFILIMFMYSYRQGCSLLYTLCQLAYSAYLDWGFSVLFPHL
jgi:hypothetical protein